MQVRRPEQEQNIEVEHRPPIVASPSFFSVANSSFSSPRAADDPGQTQKRKKRRGTKSSECKTSHSKL
jgi:hypothetical protein